MDSKIYDLLKIITKHETISITEIAKLKRINYLDIISDIKLLYEKDYICKLIPVSKSSPSTETSKGALEINAQLTITPVGRIALKKYKMEKRNFILLEIRNWISFVLSIVSFILYFYSL